MNDLPNAFQRRLALLRVLCRGPVEQSEIPLGMYMELDVPDYDLVDPKKLGDDLKNDLRALRQRGVDIRCDSPDYVYVLVDYGAFSPVDLAPADQETLAFLAETFGSEAPNQAAVQRLIERITSWLPPAAREKQPDLALPQFV